MWKAPSIVPSTYELINGGCYSLSLLPFFLNSFLKFMLPLALLISQTIEVKPIVFLKSLFFF